MATYAIYVFYLLFCVIKGNMKFGLRFFCLPIHPMRIGNTALTSGSSAVPQLGSCASSGCAWWL